MAVLVAIGAATIGAIIRPGSAPGAALGSRTPSSAPDPSATASTGSVAATNPTAGAQASDNPPAGAGPQARGAPIVTVYQETSPKIAFGGDWSSAGHPDYLGRAALWSSQRGASATLRFTGTSIAWIGPVGPTRGRASVYIDGTFDRTIDTHAARFSASRVLYSVRFPTDRARTIRIVVLGTNGHALVAVDALVVRAPGRVLTPDPPAPAPGSPPPSDPTAAAGSTYGPGIGADAISNTQVGGPVCGCANLMSAYRFRATTSSSLASVRIYVVDGAGYAGGSGGTIRVSIETDSGGVPSGTELAAAAIQPGNPVRIGYLPLVTFASPAALQAGQLYHVVFRNTDPSPTVNYVSVNSLWTAATLTPRQPSLSDLDWAQLVNTGGGWSVRPNFTPILDLGYANGVHAGMGYMEVWVNAARSISGASAVREQFSPRVDHGVTTVAIRVKRLSGTSPLAVRLQTAAGTVLATGSIAAASVGSTSSWLTVSLSTGVALQAGVAYQLVLGAPADSVYSAYGVERGNNYQFSSSTYFADGYGQYTTGAGWTGFDQPGGSTNNTNADLQFLFR